jgi:hypothetical protein
MGTTERQDSDFRYRIVSGYGGHRLTWHSLECKVGRSAKRSKLTVHTPENRRARLKVRTGRTPYYTDSMAGCCLGRQSSRTHSPKYSEAEASALLNKAREAGLSAGNADTPIPMIVGTPKGGLLGTALGADIDPAEPVYHVSDGACGFAWVVIRPGNCSFARQVKKLRTPWGPRPWGGRAYGGGVSIWISDHNQSLSRKEAHADAFAAVLKEAGVDAYSQSRMD